MVEILEETANLSMGMPKSKRMPSMKSATVMILRKSVQSLEESITTAAEQVIYNDLMQQINMYEFQITVSCYSEKFIREAISDFKRMLYKEHYRMH